MNRGEYLHLLAERTTLQRMIAKTPAGNIIARSSLVDRLKNIESAISSAAPDEQLTELRPIEILDRPPTLRF